MAPIGYSPEANGLPASLAGASALTFGQHASAQATLAPQVVAAARDPLAACALIYALLLDKSDPVAYQVQLGLIKQAAPAQCALTSLLLEQTAHLPRSARVPLIDLAMPALSLLSVGVRGDFLSLVSRLIAADQRMTQAEFVLQTVLEQRLGSKAGRAVAVRYAALGELKKETALLLSLMAQTAGGQHRQHSSAAAFMRAAISMPQLSLSERDIVVAKVLDFFEVKQALEKLNQLAPLAKPFLIRLLLTAVGDTISDTSADLLRSVCAAVDAPVPELVAQTYTAHHWDYQ